MRYVDVYFTLSQNYDIRDINEMPLSFGMKALEKAIDETVTTKAWELYLVLLPNWDSKDRMQFSDFLKKVKRGTPDSLTTTIDERDLQRYADIADLQRHKVHGDRK